MKTFAEYRRQPHFGCSVDEEFDSWLITPLSRHRDSDTLTRSNHEVGVAALKAAEPEDGDDYRVLNFGHWAVGWVEIVIVRPGSKCAEAAEEMDRQLDDYPVLDEEAFSELEDEEYRQAWIDGGAAEFRAKLVKEFGLSGRAEQLLDDADPADLAVFYEHLRPNGEYCLHEGSGAHIFNEEAVKRCTRHQIGKFLRQLRDEAIAAT